MPTPKQWWAPVWKGLVMDSDGRHYRRMKQAVWLFLYLLLNADRRSGFLVRKLRTISADMGISRDTAIRWLTLLRKEGYVATRNTGRCLCIQVTKWKPLTEARARPPQRWQAPNSVSTASSPSTPGKPEHNPDQPYRTSASDATPKEIAIKDNLLKNKENISLGAGPATPAKAAPSPEERLARDLAEGLNDLQGWRHYLAYAQRYPEPLLRRLLGQVREDPSSSVRSNRGPLFHYLLPKYVQTTAYRPGA